MVSLTRLAERDLSPGPRATARLMILGASLFWSFGGLLIKAVDLPPLLLAGLRSLFATMALLVLTQAPAWWRGTPMKFPRLTQRSEWLGVIAYVATVTLYVSSTKLTTAANSIFLQCTAPAWIALFSAAYLHERLSRWDYAAIGGVGLGMLMFVGDGFSTGAWLGDGLGLASGISYAWLTLALRKQKDGHPLGSVLVGNAATALILIPLGLWLTPASVSPVNWFWLLIVGVFQLAIPYALFCRGIRGVTAVESSLLVMIEPVLNPLWVFVILGESPSRGALLGGALILLSVVLRSAVAESKSKSSSVSSNT
jgi:drug/metabolite transporter (DMT)-like permease